MYKQKVPAVTLIKGTYLWSDIHICSRWELTQYVEVLQWGAAGGQLLYIWVTHSAVGGEEEFAQARQAAGEVLETSGAALQCGTPAQVQLLQHPEQPQREPGLLTHSLKTDKLCFASVV